MGRIFVSHSSKDNAKAIALGRWFEREGWDDYFLDLHADRGIAAGQRWEKALNDAAQRCQAVLFLISPAWLQSKWCLEELQLAHRLNKQIFGVVIEEVRLADVPAKLKDYWQLVDLAAGRDHTKPESIELPDGGEGYVTFSRSGLARLKVGLTKAEIDARFFAWPPADDPERAPYRGMRPLEAEDAGIFYGREAPIIAVMDRLRGLREEAPPRLMAIIAASGAGKSSFLRAGLMPRLARDDRTFLPLPVLRPERAAISGPTGLTEVLFQAMKARGLKGTRASIANSVAGGASEVVKLLADLAEAARPQAADDETQPDIPTLILPIDQGEELFQAEGGEEALALVALLADLLVMERPKLIAMVAIRSDSYERLQLAPELEGIRQTAFSLPPLPRGAYQTVIEGPAARLKDSDRPLRIDPALTAELLKDIEDGGAKDALPLLAFTLERLYARQEGEAELTLAAYVAMGGIGGSIEEAVNRALARAKDDLAMPRNDSARLALLRQAMIPWLAGIDPDNGTPRRQVARLSEIPEEARPMVRHLVAERLLSTEQIFVSSLPSGTPVLGAAALQPKSEVTVEPAHEALLRQWSLLAGWLKEDAGRLATLESVKRATRDWEANARNAAWLSHQAGRLEDAEKLNERADLAAKLGTQDRAYLAAAREAETSRRNREVNDARRLAEAQRRIAMRTRIGAIAATFLALMAGALAWWGLDRASVASDALTVAEDQTKAAEEATMQAVNARNAAEVGAARLSIDVADSLINRGQPDAAALMLLNAALKFDDDSAPDEMLITLGRVLEVLASRTVIPLAKGLQPLEARDALYFFEPRSNDVWRYDGTTLPKVVVKGGSPEHPIAKLGIATDGQLLTIIRKDGQILRAKPFSQAKMTHRLAIPAGTLLDPMEVTIAGDGMVMFQPNIHKEGEVGLQLESTSGATYSVNNVDIRPDYYRSADGRMFLIDVDGNYELKIDGKNISIGAVNIDKTFIMDLQHRDCFEYGLSDLPADRGILPNIDDLEMERSCFRYLSETYGESVIYSRSVSNSGGGRSINTFLRNRNDDEDEESDVDQVVGSLSGTTLDVNAISWIGIDRENNRIGVIAGRDVFVLDESLIYTHRKHKSRPGPARFVAGGKLAVFDKDLGSIVVYDPYVEETETLPEGHISEPLSKGNCASSGGMSNLPAYLNQAIKFADGRVGIFGTVERDDQTFQTLSITGNESEIVLELGISVCLQVSHDASKIMLHDENQALFIFETEHVLADKALDKTSAIQVPGTFHSAFFVGEEGDVITADFTHIVQRWNQDADGAWSATAIYDGDREVMYAEPDRNGGKLALLETLGESYLRAVLYSVTSQRRWKELGSEYKQIGIAFSAEGDVLVGLGLEANLFTLAPLQKLAADVKANLPEHCKPTITDDFTSSACWPN